MTQTPVTGTTDVEVEFVFEIPNGGATPAYNVTIEVAQELCTEDAAAKVVPNDPETGKYIILQQSAMSYKFGRVLTQAESQNFAVGILNMGGAILVHYDDVFKRRHKLLCRMATYKDTDGSHKVKPCGVDEAT